MLFGCVGEVGGERGAITDVVLGRCIRAALLCADLGDESVTERTLCSGSARSTSIEMPVLIGRS
jgi:hypothetical protein